MLHVVDQRYPERVAKPLDVSLGGTGKKTAAEALAVFDGIPLVSVGTQNGPVPIEANGKIHNNFLPEITPTDISIVGPAFVYERQPTKFWITDYDINKIYNISVSKGTISVNHDTFTYTSPSIVGENDSVTITINNVNIIKPIEVGTFTPLEITSNAFTNQSTRRVVWRAAFLGEPPPNTYLAGYLTISTTSDFSTNVNGFPATLYQIPIGSVVPDYPDVEFEAIAVNLLEFTTYYYKVICQYEDNTTELPIITSTEVSGTFSTGDFIPSVNIQRIADPNGDFIGSRFGDGKYGISMSNDGTFITAYNERGFYDGTNDYDGVSIYKLNITTGLYEHRQDIAFGQNMVWELYDVPGGVLSAVSGNGQYFVLAGQGSPATPPNLSLHTWNSGTNQFDFHSDTGFLNDVNDPADGSSYGSLTSLKINYDGTVIIHGENYRSHATSLNEALVIWMKTGVSWFNNVQQIITQADLDLVEPTQFSDFAWAVDMSDSGNRIVVTARTVNVPGDGNLGAAYVLKRVGNNYVLEQKLRPAAAPKYFGKNVSMSRDGNRVAVSATDNTSQGRVNGTVYIFEWNGASWIETATIPYPYADAIPSEPGMGALFGHSLKFNDNGTQLLIGAPGAVTRNTSDYVISYRSGGVFLYKFNLNTLTWEKIKSYYDLEYYADLSHQEFPLFGNCVEMSVDGNIVAITSPKYGYSSSFTTSINSPNISIFK